MTYDVSLAGIDAQDLVDDLGLSPLRCAGVLLDD